jgi:hypothetical protein
MAKFLGNVYNFFVQKAVMEAVLRYLVQIPLCIIFLSLDIYLLNMGYSLAFVLGIIPVLLCTFMSFTYPILHIIKPLIWHISKNEIQSKVESILSEGKAGEESSETLIHKLLNKYLLFKKPYLLLYTIGTGIYVIFLIFCIKALSNAE